MTPLDKLRAAIADVTGMVDGTSELPHPIDQNLVYPYALGHLMSSVRIYLDEVSPNQAVRGNSE